MTTILTSALLTRAGFIHGFSTRLGGVSAAPFDSLNLARAVGDDPAHVEENYRRFATAIHVDLARLYETSQVHGADVQLVRSADDVVATRSLQADAIVTREPGVTVAVRVADCVPILIADPETGAVAAVHAGWRGTVSRVIDRALDVLLASSGPESAARLLAAVGPHIGPEAFEVGEDVAQEIAAHAHGESVIVRGYDKPHVDLGRVVAAQLVARGVLPGNVDAVGGSTFSDVTTFHSFRRDGKRSGRLLGAIAARVGSTPAAW